LLLLVLEIPFGPSIARGDLLQSLARVEQCRAIKFELGFDERDILIECHSDAFDRRQQFIRNTLMARRANMVRRRASKFRAKALQLLCILIALQVSLKRGHSLFERRAVLRLGAIFAPDRL
jgi:uncharacterized protein (UPF0335 family)